MGETREQTRARLARELPRRRRELAGVRARAGAVRGRIGRLLAGIRRRSVPRQVRRPHEVVVTSVGNQSARTSSIELIVLHDTEGGNVRGTADLQGVISWFNNPSAQGCLLRR